jgi:hypothetical protein
MRRILFVLTVAALMAAMMLTAGPAQANVGNMGNSSNFVLSGGSLFGFGTGFDFDDDNGFDFGHNCCGHNFGNNGISFGGIDQDSHSGGVSIGSNVS